ETASRAGFDSLTDCLDELERCGNEVRPAEGESTLLGLDGLFDEDDEAFEARLLGPEPRRWPRRLLGGLGALAAAGLPAVMLARHGSGGPAEVQAPTAPRPVAVSTPVPPAHHLAGPHRAHARRPRHRPSAHVHLPKTQASQPPPSTSPTSTSSASS